MKSKIILSFTMALMLTGCSHMQGEFDCPVGKGISCHSMKTIDHLASQGYFNDRPLPQWKINIDKANKHHHKSAVYIVMN